MESIIREQVRVFLNKNKDYGDSYQDQLDKYGIVAFKVVAGFKVARMLQFVATGELENESAKDSALDLLNYSIMTSMWTKKDPTLNRFVKEIYKILESKENILKYYLKPLQELLNLSDEEIAGVSEVYNSFLHKED